MISSNNKNDNENKIKSHIKPLPDGSYEIYKNEMKSFYYVLAAFLFALMSIYFLNFPQTLEKNFLWWMPLPEKC